MNVNKYVQRVDDQYLEILLNLHKPTTLRIPPEQLKIKHSNQINRTRPFKAVCEVSCQAISNNPRRTRPKVVHQHHKTHRRTGLQATCGSSTLGPFGSRWATFASQQSKRTTRTT